jgi:hypothetical protein
MPAGVYKRSTAAAPEKKGAAGDADGHGDGGGDGGGAADDGDARSRPPAPTRAAPRPPARSDDVSVRPVSRHAPTSAAAHAPAQKAASAMRFVQGDGGDEESAEREAMWCQQN